MLVLLWPSSRKDSGFCRYLVLRGRCAVFSVICAHGSFTPLECGEGCKGLRYLTGSSPLCSYMFKNRGYVLANSVLQSVALWLGLLLPSVSILQKFFGSIGIGIYCLGAAFGIWVSRLALRISERSALCLSIAVFVALGLFFVVVYPAVNVQVPGLGGDDDDAMNIGALELIHGHFPYYVRTYLGNEIHHLPGALLLAAPFVILGTSGLQNLAWLIMFFFVLCRELGRASVALRWFLLFLFSPIVLQQVATGVGHVTNAIYVMLGLWWLVTAERKILPALAWGVTLASRANFLLLIPLAFGWLNSRYGWRCSANWLLWTCFSCAVLTVPFYFHDPSNFSPLQAVDRLSQFDDVIPHAGWAIAILMLSASIVLAGTPMRTASNLWRNCALVQAVPVIIGSLLGRDLGFLAYGTFFLCFVIFTAATADQVESSSKRLRDNQKSFADARLSW